VRFARKGSSDQNISLKVLVKLARRMWLRMRRLPYPIKYAMVAYIR
jgi:hypothetical protein